MRAKSRQPAPKTSSTSHSAQSATRRRILIADDNPDVVESFKLMLEILGHEVETAFDGLEALEKAEQFAPDVVVLDIGMPKLDGLEAARRLRQRPWTRDVVFIAITGWGNDNDKRETAEAGFNIHLVKPVDATTIMNVLEQTDPSRSIRSDQ